jgi:hypothetical protein
MTIKDADTVHFLGSELASVLGVRPQILSKAVRKGFKSKGEPVADWAVWQVGGKRLGGYDVPMEKAEELLPASVWDKLQKHREAELADVVEPGRRASDIEDELELLAERGDGPALEALKQVLVRAAEAVGTCAASTRDVPDHIEEATGLTEAEVETLLTTCRARINDALREEAPIEGTPSEEALSEEAPSS